MRPMTRWTTAGALVAAALSWPLSAPAHSAPAPSAPASLYAPSALVLTVGHGEKAAGTTAERAVTLNCAPTPSGTHPDVRNACAELAEAEGDLDRLITLGERDGRYCTKEYRPVVVTAQGVWRGERVDYEHTFGNTCVKDGAGGSVFAF
ncbi:subtilase-type protease inhibitor [Streptomyces sp. NPDC005931]|uniref:subtilase-type protease inhibitor n=1 Tax=Streptomyces sp. NPDC005931 TaxID=3364737 RepID=UPI0036BBD4D0